MQTFLHPLETVVTADRRIHWRLQSAPLRQFIHFSAEELAELESAAGHLERSGLVERADRLRGLAVKLRAVVRRPSSEELEAALEALMGAEGLAMRPGPKESLEEGLLSLVRDAITTRRTIEFDYRSRTTGQRSRQRVQPYGVLYGNRTFLAGRTDWANDMRLWRLANVSDARLADEAFDRDPAFDLRSYAERSFGTFQEEPVEVELRFDADAAPDAKVFRFHPSQIITENDDGSLQGRRHPGNVLAPRNLGRERHGRTAGHPSPVAGRNVRLARGSPPRRVSRSRNLILTKNLGVGAVRFRDTLQPPAPQPPNHGKESGGPSPTAIGTTPPDKHST